MTVDGRAGGRAGGLAGGRAGGRAGATEVVVRQGATVKELKRVVALQVARREGSGINWYVPPFAPLAHTNVRLTQRHGREGWTGRTSGGGTR